ncbi:hypothetical protein GA0070616_0066 [Micromonospora nigra]|uniref:N-terminal domain-containing protein n=1 Tax=Micromonospora nigra TaxID=145857 RepID=A0A1C6R7D2_9ACTN|nr:ArdC family protein [Micromonospora nigra]SCL12925.1 hypothetical protein GA0070616_0066 [Micromonospora nigra]
MPRKSTARNATSRKSGTRSRYSDEQIKEFRQRDRQVMSRSTEHLEDAEGIRRFAQHAATGGVSLRILAYSLRNQALLAQQADERGFVLSDVDSVKGWRQRGRFVRKGETGLRLIKPVGKDKKDTDADEPEASDEREDDADDTDETGEDNGKPKFRTGVVFDVAQTAEIPPEERGQCAACNAEAGEPCNPGCLCPTCTDYEPVGDAAEILWNNLLDQLTAAGYALDWPAPADALHGHRVHVDHEGRTVAAAFEVTAEHPAAVADLAAAVAQIIARSDRERETRREQRRTARAALTATPATA